MKQPDYPKARVEELRRQVAYAERVKQVMDRIHAATDLDQIFVELLDEILSLFDAEHLTLYAVDYDKREIYSRFLDLDEIKEIRVPFNEQSVVGFVARNRKVVNIADAYDEAELLRLSATLSFDRSWDQRTGVRTRQMLTVPLCASSNLLTGILQLINKKSASRFTAEDEDQVHAIGQTLGIALYNQYGANRCCPRLRMKKNQWVTGADSDVWVGMVAEMVTVCMAIARSSFPAASRRSPSETMW